MHVPTYERVHLTGGNVYTKLGVHDFVIGKI